MPLLSIIGVLLLFFGLILMTAGSIGLIRFPDFYTRTHAASKVDTVGSVVSLLGIALIAGTEVDAAKALMAAIVIMLTNPVAAHFLARAAYRSGLRPWKAGDKPSQPKSEAS